MTIKKTLITIVLLGITGLCLSHWFGCHPDSKFFFSALDLKLRIIFDIRTDQNVSSAVARLLHNKLAQGSVDIFNAYVHFWDIRFLMMLLSPFTLFGLFCSVYYVIKRKTNLLLSEKTLVLLCLLAPVPIMFGFMKNELMTVVLFAIPLIVLSLHGLFLFMEKHSNAWIYYIFLITFSLWYALILDSNLIVFCTP